MKSGDVLSHFTELDRSVLKGNDEYVRYFEFLHKAFSILIQSFTERTTDDPLEIQIVQGFIQKFLNTIEALRMKYTYEQENSMLIDVTDSSFPNHLELKKLVADLGRKDEELGNLPTEEALKRATLDYIFDKKARPEALLQQLGRRYYYEMLHPVTMFLDFNSGDLVPLNNGEKVDGLRQYLYSWSSYDSITNRPFVYILIFDHQEKTYRLNQDDAQKQQFLESIKKISHDSSPLRVVASDIDTAHDDIMPKVLKRIDLGPLYGRYSQDEHPLTEMIKNHFEPDDFAFTWTTEIIFSIGETRTKSFLSTGDLRQIFFIDESNRECVERHVSEVHKYMLTSHHVVQHLRETHETLLVGFSSAPITYNKSTGGIYGKK